MYFSCNPENLRNIVEYLCFEIGPRPLKQPAILEKVVEYLEERLRGFNFATKRQKITYKGQEYFNLIAAHPDIDPLSPSDEDLLVVGAHYDTVSTTPGADDNASAVAGLLEIANALKENIPKGLRLVFFAMEEPPVYRTKYMASYHYARYLKKNHQSLRGMICLEMIGYFSTRPNSQKYPFPLMDKIYPTTGDFIAMVGNVKSKPFTLELMDRFKRYSDLPVETLNAPAIVIGIDFSDHWSFNKMGYQAVMVTDTAFYRNPHYHRPTDLPATLDYSRAAKVVTGLVGAIGEICR